MTSLQDRYRRIVHLPSPRNRRVRSRIAAPYSGTLGKPEHRSSASVLRVNCSGLPASAARAQWPAGTPNGSDNGQDFPESFDPRGVLVLSIPMIGYRGRMKNDWIRIAARYKVFECNPSFQLRSSLSDPRFRGAWWRSGWISARALTDISITKGPAGRDGAFLLSASVPGTQ